VAVSAKTGEGIAEALRAIEADLPRPGIAFEALLPYERGDLLNKIHVNGEIDSVEPGKSCSLPGSMGVRSTADPSHLPRVGTATRHIRNARGRRPVTSATPTRRTADPRTAPPGVPR
jgi:hypothetical protein